MYLARDVSQLLKVYLVSASETSSSNKALLTSIPIGRAWHIVVVDIPEISLSPNNNRYLVIVQDYITKWLEAIPLPDRKASSITAEPVNQFSRIGILEVLHFDQGIFFEKTLLRQTMEEFGNHKPRKIAYHPQR